MGASGGRRGGSLDACFGDYGGMRPKVEQAIGQENLHFLKWVSTVEFGELFCQGKDFWEIEMMRRTQVLLFWSLFLNIKMELVFNSEFYIVYF